MDAQSDHGLHCLHMPEDTHSHGSAQMTLIGWHIVKHELIILLLPHHSMVMFFTTDQKIVRQVSHKPAVPLIKPDEPEAARRSPSPARNPTSKIVHVRNLVRPFTLGQLKELLRRTGPYMEEAFWIDKIKSHCFVTVCK